MRIHIITVSTWRDSRTWFSNAKGYIFFPNLGEEFTGYRKDENKTWVLKISLECPFKQFWKIISKWIYTFVVNMSYSLLFMVSLIVKTLPLGRRVGLSVPARWLRRCRTWCRREQAAPDRRTAGWSAPASLPPQAYTATGSETHPLKCWYSVNRLWLLRVQIPDPTPIS